MSDKRMFLPLLSTCTRRALQAAHLSCSPCLPPRRILRATSRRQPSPQVPPTSSRRQYPLTTAPVPRPLSGFRNQRLVTGLLSDGNSLMSQPAAVFVSLIWAGSPGPPSVTVAVSP